MSAIPATDALEQFAKDAIKQVAQNNLVAACQILSDGIISIIEIQLGVNLTKDEKDPNNQKKQIEPITLAVAAAIIDYARYNTSVQNVTASMTPVTTTNVEPPDCPIWINIYQHLGV
jgi:hypothetical protein